MTSNLTFAFNPLGTLFMTYSHAKVQGQRSIGSEDRVEMNRQTDGDDCITSLANAVVITIYAFCKLSKDHNFRGSKALTPDSLTVTSLILSTFASDNPLIAHSFFFVDIWTPCNYRKQTTRKQTALHRGHTYRIRLTQVTLDLDLCMTSIFNPLQDTVMAYSSMQKLKVNDQFVPKMEW